MPNPIIHWELMVDDIERTKRFYSAIFDWKFAPAGPEYTLIDTGAPPGGGLMQRPPSAPMACLNTYFRVDDLDATLRRAVEAGAQVLVPRMEIPGKGWFAMLADPDRIPIAIFQPAPGM